VVDPETHVDPDTGVHYLDPIQYEPAYKFGKFVGWKVPDRERERWDNPPKVAAPAAKPPEKPRPVQQLIVELEAWLDLTPSLERQLRAVYDLDPMRTSRTAATVVQGAQAHRLTNPAGLLVLRLREIAAQAKPVEVPSDDPVRSDAGSRAGVREETTPGRTAPPPRRQEIQGPLEAGSDGVAVAGEAEEIDLAYLDQIAPDEAA